MKTRFFLIALNLFIYGLPASVFAQVPFDEYTIDGVGGSGISNRMSAYAGTGLTVWAPG